MANQVILKRSNVTGKVPTTTDVGAGELAINTADGRLFFGTGSAVIEAISDQGGTITGNLIVNGRVSVDNDYDTINDLPSASSYPGTYVTVAGISYYSNGTTWIRIPSYVWVVKTANYTAVDGDNIIADTNGGAFTISLPSSPSAGMTVRVKDSRGSFATNNLTLGRNGSNIIAVAEDLVLDVNHSDVTLVYQDSTVGWTI